MSTIISSVDFSESSLNAARYAAALAASIEANLILVNVVQFPAAVAEAAVSEQTYEEMVSLAQHDLENVAGELANRVNHSISIAADVLEGTVDYQIEVIAEKYKPFSIVMGIRSGRNFERFLAGSHALFALRHSHYPILIIPEGCLFNGFKNIGLATDLNHVKEEPVESVRRHMSAFNATLHVVHVSKNINKAISEEASEPISLANQLSGFKPKFYYVKNENISEGLREFCQLHNLDLLIIIPKEHGLLDLFSEKHSSRIATHMKIPVLAIPPQLLHQTSDYTIM
ncbi:MAG: hypothetical protein C5B59_03655 [Bacteroidetes bacterium]|nr:MAG: hypothetical protein C5B59_03655 [Bacteroidota bacterium]